MMTNMSHTFSFSRALMATAAVGLTWMTFVGCGDDPEPDRSEPLTCSGETCDLLCEDGTAEPCLAECEQGADCDLDCNGLACNLDCSSKSECTADCELEGGCDTDCEGQSTCTVDCSQSGNCNLDCAGGSDCNITCESDCGGGCTGNSDCNLACDNDCGIACTGNTNCQLDCTTDCFVCCDGSATCALNCTDDETTECDVGGGTIILVCGRDCPSDDSACVYEKDGGSEPTGDGGGSIVE